MSIWIRKLRKSPFSTPFGSSPSHEKQEDKRPCHERICLNCKKRDVSSVLLRKVNIPKDLQISI
jgi:hypothetical protein